MISSRSINKFKEIYRKEFGIELSHDDAVEQAERLLNLARVVTQPLPKKYECRYRQILEEQKNYVAQNK